MSKNIDFKDQLLSLQDLDYKYFNQKLIPNIDKDTIIGVRIPDLRKLATKIHKNSPQKLRDFLKNTPHAYFEQNNLHILLIDFILEREEKIQEIDSFFQFVDNWSTSDLALTLKLEDIIDDIYQLIPKWLESEHTYKIRLAIGLLMKYYLDQRFNQDIIQMVVEVKSDDYYVNMMRAWFFAEGLVKKEKKFLDLVKSQKLDKFTQNKTISKARESLRISKDIKKEINNFKIGYNT